MPMLSALILEDHPHAREWLAGALDKAFPGIGIQAVPTCAQAHEWLRTACPDLALVDLELPDGSGVDVVASLARSHPGCTSIVATIFDDDEHLFSSLRAGARGYLLKDRGQDELVEMLRGIVDGRPPLSPAIARRLLGHFQQAPTVPMAGAPSPAPLTTRETMVLGCIARGHTLAEAAQQLGLSRHTVAGYVKDVYRKLDINSRAEAALEAARRGLIEPR
jgi:DNA-binding NarL/FixJ family response regulator